MKFFAGLLSIVAFASSISASAVASQTHAAASKPLRQTIKVAPADEYFGRLKMSILGIRNTLKDLALKADYNPAAAEQIFGSAAYAEEALHEWEHKYPRDPWLAKSVAGLVHMYSRVPTTQGRAKMHAALAWLTSRYGSTKTVVAAAKAEAGAADAATTLTAQGALLGESGATAGTSSTANAGGTARNAPAAAGANAAVSPSKP